MYELKENFSPFVYLFDLDGTLADSMPAAVEIVLSLLRKKGISYPDDIVKTLTPLGFRGIAEYYAEEMGVPMTAEEIFRWFMAELQKAYAEEIPLKRTAKETLLALKGQGARLCVLTGSPHIFTDPCLRRAGVFDLFERVWSAEDFGMHKGDTRLYCEVAKVLGVGVENLLVIDDGINVIKTAKAAGAKTVGVYDSYSKEEEAEMRSLADGYVYTLDEVLSLF